MKRYDCLRVIAPHFGDELVVTNLGAVRHEWQALRPHHGNYHLQNLGLTSSMALGLALAQSQRQSQRHGRRETEILQVVIAVVRSQCLPFVAHRAQVRDHELVAEVRRYHPQTIISFHFATSELVYSERWLSASSMTVRASDYLE